MSPDKQTPLPPDLVAKNKRTAKWLCGGMLVFYNGFFATMTAINPDPPETARRAFSYITGNCLGMTEAIPGKTGSEMWPPLKAATCLFSMAGAPGTLAAGYASSIYGTRPAP